MNRPTQPDTACPACHSAASRPYLRGVRDWYHGVEGEWDLIECVDCGLTYLSPFIAESHIAECYPKDYNPLDSGRAHPLVRFLKALTILPYTLRFGQPGYSPRSFGQGDFLDIGCGAGLNIHEMSGLGWRCTGVDISAPAIEYARKNNPDAEFHVGLASDMAPDERFDLIAMHHVLEHLHRPRQALAACHGLLRPGGRLVVNVPNIGSLEARLFGRRWKGLDIPRHLLHFKEEVLERFLLEAGFSIESKRPGMFATSISESLIMCLPASLRYRMIHSRAGHFFYQLLLPLAALSYLFGNRGTVEIVAIKPQARNF